MNTEKLEGAKKLFFILLGIDIALSVGVVLSAFSTIGALNDIQSGAKRIDQSLINSLKFWEYFPGLIYLSAIGVGLGLVKWLNSCYRFAKESLAATGLKNERWTTAGWIIPFVNLFKPYQIVNEIYKVGAPTYTVSDGWKKEGFSVLLLTWWMFWVVTHFVGGMISKQLFTGTMRDGVTLQQVTRVIGLNAAVCIVSIIVAGLWFVVANALTRRLLARSVLPAARGALQQSELAVSPTASSAVADAPTIDAAYEKIDQELKSDTLDRATWTRAQGDAEGNAGRAKALYIKYRAQRLLAATLNESGHQATFDAPSVEKPAKRYNSRFVAATAGIVVSAVLAIIVVGFFNGWPAPTNGAVSGDNPYDKFVSEKAGTSHLKPLFDEPAAPKMREVFPGFSVADSAPAATAPRMREVFPGFSVADDAPAASTQDPTDPDVINAAHAKPGTFIPLEPPPPAKLEKEPSRKGESDIKVAQRHQRAEEVISLRYPNWRKIVGSQNGNPTAYRKWLATQPTDYQAKINSTWNANEIVGSIDKFKAETN